MRVGKTFLRTVLYAAVFFTAPYFAHAGVVDKVIVVVNDEVITQREFDKMFIPVQKNYEANLKGEELKKRLEAAKQGLLEQLINAKLILSLAKKEKIEVNEEELEKRMDKIRSFYGSPAEFSRVLDEAGTSVTEFEREMRDQMLGQKYVEKEIASSITVTPSEVKDLYEKNKDKLIAPENVKVRTIMMRKSDDQAENGKKKGELKNVIAQLKQGKPASELAQQYSEGPYSKDGGDMGRITKGQMLKEIDDVIFSLKQGEVSDIVETHVGYHVFLVEEKQPSRLLELAEVNDFLREQLFMKKFEEAMVRWIEEKRKSAYVSYK